MRGFLKKICDLTFKKLPDEVDTKLEGKAEDQSSEDSYSEDDYLEHDICRYYDKYASLGEQCSDITYSDKIIDEAHASYNVSLWDEKDYYID